MPGFDLEPIKESVEYFKPKGLTSLEDLDIEILKPSGTSNFLINLRYGNETRQYDDVTLVSIFTSRV